MRRLVPLLACCLLLGACVGTTSAAPVRIGAIYPLSGSQGPGGIDEYRGVLLAAELANEDGGVGGRPLDVASIDVASADAAPGAVQQLRDQGVSIVMGSYGSTIAEAAAPVATADGMLFWETGAVGMLPQTAEPGDLTFRVPPSGGVLGRNAIAFVADRLAAKLGRDPASLRFAISYIDDVYGRTVADGAERELAARGLRLVGSFGYDYRRLDADVLARRIAAKRVDVLFVSAYLDDGIALRRALVRNHVALLANIGTSSSYCMPAFGQTLGADAVGVFASDKPAAAALDPAGLTDEAAALLARADDAYVARYGEAMSPPALAGFSAAWALFRDVLPAADGLSASAVADAARATDLPRGSLPNGSGLRFGAAGTTEAGDNLHAASVIWEWVEPGTAAVVWPPAFATEPVRALEIS
jgi:branched-chain amino acid transport system substrate-binding protein